MIKYIPLLELPILIIMVLARSMMLRRYGIRAIVFGDTDKTDYIIIPIAIFFFYGIFSTALNLPFPIVLTSTFWDIGILNIFAVAICTISIAWFGITLKTFGKSFRVGIDENTKDKLITKGTFAISRNPIYIAFIVFFLGIFIEHPSILSSLFLVLLILTIHRQILREEKFLKNHYGIEYEEYCKKIRRYI